MCGRISQRTLDRQLTAELGWAAVHPTGPPPRLRHNTPPGTTPLVLHCLAGQPAAQSMFWGYKPHWYERQPVINARLDTILKGSPMWRPTLTRRIIVPADGWFEWTGEPGQKQPWFIHAKDGKPIFLAAISGWKDGEEGPEHGFAIVTDDSAGGMVDIHDRRPMALKPHDALAWMSPDTAKDDALELLSTARPESAFQWHQVTKKINSSRYESADALEPIGP